MTVTTDGPIAIVGTDTGVGKTVIAAGLVRQLRSDGIDARAIKPAQTGYPPDDDAGFVAEACGEDDAATCLRYLEPPLAPRVAASETGESLTYEEIHTACQRAIDATPVALIEGIGGLRVPLADDREVIDLVADCAEAAVVVTRSGLGTLNHTALSVEALQRRDLPVRGIVCNQYEGATLAERTNPDELTRMTGHPVETVPPIAATEPQTLADGVCDALSPAFVDRLREPVEN